MGEVECSYIMANALCPCEVSAGRWCIPQQTRANGQKKQGEGWRWEECRGETRDEGDDKRLKKAKRPPLPASFVL